MASPSRCACCWQLQVLAHGAGGMHAPAACSCSGPMRACRMRLPHILPACTPSPHARSECGALAVPERALAVPERALAVPERILTTSTCTQNPPASALPTLLALPPAFEWKSPHAVSRPCISSSDTRRLPPTSSPTIRCSASGATVQTWSTMATG